MREFSEALYMLLALMLGVHLCHFLPLFLPKCVLAAPVLHKLNRVLPLVIMLLLVMTSVKLPAAGADVPMFVAQTLSLVLVVATYHRLRNMLLSVVVGLMSLNALLYVLA